MQPSVQTVISIGRTAYLFATTYPEIVVAFLCGLFLGVLVAILTIERGRAVSCGVRVRQYEHQVEQVPEYVSASLSAPRIPPSGE